MGEPEKQASAATVGMTVKIDPDEISKAVADAVLASEIGPLVKKAVVAVLSEEKSWGQTRIEKAVQEQILEIVKEVVVRDMLLSIEARAREVLEQEGFVNKAIASVVEKLLRDVTR